MRIPEIKTDTKILLAMGIATAAVFADDVINYHNKPISNIYKKYSSGLLNPTQALGCYTKGGERLLKVYLTGSEPSPIEQALQENNAPMESINLNILDLPPKTIQRRQLTNISEYLLRSPEFKDMALQRFAQGGYQFRLVDYDSPITGQVAIDKDKKLELKPLPNSEIEPISNIKPYENGTPITFGSEVQIFDKEGHLAEAWPMIYLPIEDIRTKAGVVGFIPREIIDNTRDICGFPKSDGYKFIQTNTNKLNATPKKVFDFNPLLNYEIADDSSELSEKLVPLANENWFKAWALNLQNKGDKVLLASYKGHNHGLILNPDQMTQTGHFDKDTTLQILNGDGNIQWDNEIIVIRPDGKIERWTESKDQNSSVPLWPLNDPDNDLEFVSTKDPVDLEEVFQYDPNKSYKPRSLPFLIPHLPIDSTTLDPKDLSAPSLLQLMTDHELWASQLGLMGEGYTLKMVAEGDGASAEVVADEGVIPIWAPGDHQIDENIIDKGTIFPYKYKLIALKDGQVQASWIILGKSGASESISLQEGDGKPLLKLYPSPTEETYDLTPFGVTKSQNL